MRIAYVATTCVVVLAVDGCVDVTPPDAASPTGAARTLAAPGATVVWPGAMQGWSFYNDQQSTACTDATKCSMVSGPAGQPSGSGSALLSTASASEGNALILAAYAGTRLDRITELSYSTYRSSADAGNNLAIALQLNVDYDVTDAAAGYQGRIVYEPYHSNGGQVAQGTWQRWNTLTGKWWGTKSTVTRNGAPTTNPCVQATPCTWAELLSAFPNAGVHATYGAVVLKAGSGWGVFQGNVDRFVIGIDSTNTTFDFEQTAPVSSGVTLIPPDSTPHALFASLGSVSEAPLSEGPFLKDIVLVEFKPGTPLQSRQAAIDAVGGHVVGGKVNPDGLDGAYYVQIYGGTSASLVSAVATLQQLPSVGLAAWWPLFAEDVSSYRRPVDGVDGWRDWKLDPSLTSSGRANWALEYVRAPFAWGCSVGSSATTIAVVDHYLHMNANIRANVDSAHSSLLLHNENKFKNDRHGTRVASVLGAVGNDSVGMTGMMWHARLILRDGWAKADDPFAFAPNFDVSHEKNIEDQIVAAGEQGASVINLSIGVHARRSNSGTVAVFDPNNEYDADNMRTWKGLVTQAIARLAQKGLTPLFVIAAGNDGVDAHAVGTAAAKDDYPNQVLVVGGLDANGARWVQSDTGSLVDIWAPAVAVSQADSNDAIVSDEPGTSFSAPLAAGVAGLLKDWDPSLSAAQIKTYIILGARSEGGLKKLDAYGALKAAATRSNAPLCGNRVWNDGTNHIFAERGSAVDELTSRSINDYAAFVNPFHGGRKFELGFSYQYGFDFLHRNWREVPYEDATVQDYSGSYLGYAWAADHDNKLWTSRQDTADATGQEVRVKLLEANTRRLLVDFGAMHIPGTEPTPAKTCILQYPIGANGYVSVLANEFVGSECVGYAVAGRWNAISQTGEASPTPIIAVPAPQGDAVYVPVSLRGITATYTGLTQICNQADTAGHAWVLQTDSLRRCANPTATIDSTVRAFVYRIDVATKQWSLVPLNDNGSTTKENREINSLMVSEDGKELMLSLTRRKNLTGAAGPEACFDETLEWISMDTSSTAPNPAGKVIKRVSVPQGAACGGWVEAGGTVSPYMGMSGGGMSLSKRSNSRLLLSRAPKQVPRRRYFSIDPAPPVKPGLNRIR